MAYCINVAILQNTRSATLVSWEDHKCYSSVEAVSKGFPAVEGVENRHFTERMRVATRVV